MKRGKKRIRVESTENDASGAGLPDFFLVQYTKTRKNAPKYQKGAK
jgi:hypothetical protein